MTYKELNRPRLEDASDAFMGLFSDLTNYNVVAVKVHTNGLPHHDEPLPSVLGISAAKFTLFPRIGYDEAEKYERFYYPRGSFNTDAVERNGLSREVIRRRRVGCDYPEYYDENQDAFRLWCGETHLFVGHAISYFDAQFLPWLALGDPPPVLFDLMTENKDIVRQEWNAYRSEWKLPKFMETLHYYTEVPERGARGDTMYKVRMSILTFSEMRERAGVRLPRIAEAI